MMKTLNIQTKERVQFVDLTSEIKAAVKESGISSGICMVYCPHTTAAITVNENADPDVVRDLTMALDKVAPNSLPYKHSEGNSDAHLKSSLFGCAKHFIVENGAIVLGTWQGIYFCEFDGPRSRQAYVKIF